MVRELKKNGINQDTLIVITAKHGQSPVDSARYLGIANSANDPVTTSPATILDAAGCLPFPNPRRTPPASARPRTTFLYSGSTAAAPPPTRSACSGPLLPHRTTSPASDRSFPGRSCARISTIRDFPRPATRAPRHCRHSRYRRHLLGKHQETRRARRLLPR